jgi:hypothetical protein
VLGIFILYIFCITSFLMYLKVFRAYSITYLTDGFPHMMLCKANIKCRTQLAYFHKYVGSIIIWNPHKEILAMT